MAGGVLDRLPIDTYQQYPTDHDMNSADLLDDPGLAARYLFPRPAPLTDPFVVPVDGAELHCWRSPPRPGAPVLLHFHGNGEVVRDYVGDWAPACVAAGFDIVLAEYRGYGGSTGRPTLRALLDDALAVADMIGGRPFVYGRSVGSLPAAHVAAYRDVAGLIIESGIADLGQRLKLYAGDAYDPAALERMVAESFDQRAKLAAYGGPTLVLHTKHDHLVAVDHADRLAEWSGGRLVLFERGDHNTIHAFNHGEIMAELLRFASADER